jgi:hypothetical protein
MDSEPPDEASTPHDRTSIAVLAAEVAWLELLHEDLISGKRDWRAWNEELVGEDLQDVAIRECAAALARARAQLARLSGGAGPPIG